MSPVVGVYNRYWHSRGGGERYTGMLAQVLADGGADVRLIGHDELDVDSLGAHLGLDLSRCTPVELPDYGEPVLSDATGSYDLLVNGSYMSSLKSQAQRALYVCYFPTPLDHDMARWRRYAVRAIGPHLRAQREGGFVHGRGWFPPEGGRLRRWVWTSGEASLVVPPGPNVELRFDVARVGGEPTRLQVMLEDRELAEVEVGAEFHQHRVEVPASPTQRLMRFVSGTFRPEPPDRRTLGVAVSRLRVTGETRSPRDAFAARFPWLTRDPNDIAFLDTYDAVVGVSQYTTQWIERLWGHPAEVLYPPIQVERFAPVAERTKTIVSAGRFFAPGAGHSKRQLEQVQTFAAMLRSGRLDGWKLHLVGGCEPSQRGYLERVKAEGDGLPVEVHANAPRHLLESLMNSASIQWSATGYGEDENRSPWSSEHFGMTTVEAMAGGCVPIVMDKAGQREIVRDGVDGYRWLTLDQLSRRTAEVAGDDGLRRRLAASALERAQLYSDASFADNVRDLVDRYHLL